MVVTVASVLCSSSSELLIWRKSYGAALVDYEDMLLVAY
jgi:hypothetical protein